MLDEAGLFSAVQWYVEGFSTRSSIEVTMDCSDLGRLPTEVDITLFRLLRESLTNVHRHSGSKTALIRLNRNGAFVTLEVIDHGKGSSKIAADATPKCGVGIPGMKERVRRFGGTIDISSSSEGNSDQSPPSDSVALDRRGTEKSVKRKAQGATPSQEEHSGN